jgi:hypothetical protein
MNFTIGTRWLKRPCRLLACVLHPFKSPSSIKSLGWRSYLQTLTDPGNLEAELHAEREGNLSARVVALSLTFCPNYFRFMDHLHVRKLAGVFIKHRNTIHISFVSISHQAHTG